MFRQMEREQMPPEHLSNVHILGLTGSFGSGCSYISEHILRPLGYVSVSLSDILKNEFHEKYKVNHSSRRDLQDFGDELRREHGSEYLAKKAIDQIRNGHTEGMKWVVDSIRNPAEVQALQQCSRLFYLFGIYAEKDKRWERVKSKYSNAQNQFDEDDLNDTGNENETYGQKVGTCFEEADVVLSNNDNFEAIHNEEFGRLSGRVGQYIRIVAEPLSRKQPIGKHEPRMAMAYAASQQSSCLKRKVGALIVDEMGNVISSGYNEVPPFEKPCQKQFVDCYREKISNEFFFKELPGIIPEIKGREEELKQHFRKRFKILDYCRALHAEENAILSLVRNGRSVPLDRCTLYTTTFPCRLCAEKIVTVGLKKIVYLEPYPDHGAVSILKGAGVSFEFFEGVTFKAYFRIYGEKK
jgi:deoxycytidylate deaminase/dephospho-CoA kinase